MQCSGKLKGSAKYRIHEWAINDWFEPIAGLNRNRQACGGGGAFYFIMLIILANIVGMANGKQQPEKIHRSVSIDEKLNFEEKKNKLREYTRSTHTVWYACCLDKQISFRAYVFLRKISHRHAYSKAVTRLNVFLFNWFYFLLSLSGFFFINALSRLR